MNDAITDGRQGRPGARRDRSAGPSPEGFFPYKHASVLAAAYRLKIPVTVHIGIGYDIIHEHPNADGGVLGRASYTDFLVFAEHVKKLEGGIVLNFGTAVMGPGSLSEGAGDGPQRRPPEGRADREVHDRRVRPDPARRRLPHAGPEDRPALLLPPVEDDPGPHRRRRRRELLRAGGPQGHGAGGVEGRYFGERPRA